MVLGQGKMGIEKFNDTKLGARRYRLNIFFMGRISIKHFWENNPTTCMIASGSA
jgi:hypothetical protein